MVTTLHHAHTEPINPPGAEPALTREQVWAGLQRKVRSPAEFVPVIDSYHILSEAGDVVTRTVQFKPNFGPEGKITEVCTSYHPTQILYEMDTGDKVSNVISAGPTGEPTDLFLTYVFDLQNPKGDTESNAKVAKAAVVGTITKIRQLAKEGKI
ncbi:hypothetical protein MAPG_01408 [Magnaporthiopsis poae ATCC 64411]|uniref:DUF1857-domain-containing protein n=1 Tax=Magnaporthiopsis poae (strain ATCC 64411 / 73-15) TaxID=644358 RepID=A0A0C4DNL6_MAGP6|nr:hypothetical protein MAPG_01408 [Magnaporthiopsis poae ATCC 64411]